jgi:hypothetical protein
MVKHAASRAARARQWLEHCVHHWFKQWPTVLFLASLMVVLAKFGPTLGLEPHIMRGVHALESWDEVPDAFGLGYERRHTADVPHADQVAIVELSRRAFALDFGGQSPLPRGCIAAALMALADQADSMRGSGAPILAIDLDITLDAEGAPTRSPAPGAPPCVSRDEDIEQALLELKHRRVTVIALALERETVGQRLGRNRFVARVCSDKVEPGTGGVYFASSAVYTRGAQPLYEAPVQRRPRADLLADVAGGFELPQLYPSLGNLIAAARRLHRGESPDAQVDRLAMTSVCTAARKQAALGNSAALPLMDDVVFGIEGAAAQARVAGAYRYVLLNFHQLGVRRRDITVDRIGALAQERIVAPTAVLTVSDGSTADRFVTPSRSDDFMQGAAVHVAASLSQGNGALASAPKLVKLLADIAAGLVFSLLVVPFHGLLQRRSVRWPLLQRAFGLLLPMVAAAVVILLAAWASALLLPRGLWLNPVFMALGMLLHSYFDSARSLVRARGQPMREAPSTDFGRVVSTLSGVVDVEEPPPARHRHWLDLAFLAGWLMVFFGVIVAGWWVALHELDWR